MTMGTNGMGEMAEMHMKVPRNSLPMIGAPGPFDVIDMSGLLTLLKVREGITDYEDPGWYQHPPGTVATVATDGDLKRDGIQIPADTQKSAAARTRSLDPICGPGGKPSLLAQNEPFLPKL